MNRFQIDDSEAEGIVVIRKNNVQIAPEPDKVMPTLEEALKQVIIEWKD